MNDLERTLLIVGLLTLICGVAMVFGAFKMALDRQTYENQEQIDQLQRHVDMIQRELSMNGMHGIRRNQKLEGTDGCS